MDPENGIFEFRNVGQADAFGLELGATAGLENGWQGYANYSYQNAKNRDSGIRLTNSPVHTAKAGLSFPLVKAVRLGAQFLYESGRRTIHEDYTESFFLANLNLVSGQILSGLELSVRINNVFNASYSYPLGFWSVLDTVPQDGRNFIASLEYRF
jgi:outer membrane receptor protein involved in Fe transport